jgi:O-antigen ligase
MSDRFMGLSAIHNRYYAMGMLTSLILIIIPVIDRYSSVMGVILLVSGLGSMSLLANGLRVATPTASDFLVSLLTVSLIVSAFAKNSQSLHAYLYPLGALLTWFLMRNLLRKPQVIAGVLRGLYYVALAVAAYLLVRAIGFNMSMVKAAQIAGSANQTGMLLYVGGFLGLCGFIYHESCWALIGTSVILVCLVIIAARASWLALFVSFSSLLLMDRRALRRAIQCLSALLVLGLLALMLLLAISDTSAILSDVAIQVRRYWQKGLSGRDEIWIAGIDLWRDSPTLGYSWGVAEDLYNKLPARFQARTEGDMSMHNAWLMYLLRGGLVSALFFTLFFVSLLRTQSFHGSGIEQIVLCLLFGFLGISFFESLVVGGIGLRNLLFTTICCARLTARPIEQI